MNEARLTEGVTEPAGTGLPQHGGLGKPEYYTQSPNYKPRLETWTNEKDIDAGERLETYFRHALVIF